MAPARPSASELVPSRVVGSAVSMCCWVRGATAQVGLWRVHELDHNPEIAKWSELMAPETRLLTSRPAANSRHCLRSRAISRPAAVWLAEVAWNRDVELCG